MSCVVKVSDRYLILPVRNGARERTLHLLRNDQIVRYFSIALALDEEPDWLAFCDLEEFAGRELRVTVDGQDAPEDVMRLLELSDEPKGLQGVYEEPLRPQFHFSARRGWVNDPIGLFHCDGVYHLCFQHNPFATNAGSPHWGRAVSSDLVHWNELPVLLYPDGLGAPASGSAVVDHENTSGLGVQGEPPILLFYTAEPGAAPDVREWSQCITYSVDGGKTFQKYARNPVVREIAGGNRDPVVVRHEPSNQWIMALFLSTRREGDNGLGVFGLLGSKDLLHWRRLSEIDLHESFECPEFFELPLDGDESNKKWVFFAANGRYLVGEFDGETFHSQTELLPSYNRDWTHHKRNRGAYAAQTFSNAPAGRRIMIAWLFSDIPAKRFNQAMTFPVDLTLRTIAGVPRLCAQPVPEIEMLYRKTHTFQDTDVPAENLLRNITGDLFDISVVFVPQTHALVKLTVRGVEIFYDSDARTLRFDNKDYSLDPTDGAIDLRILVDRTSVEIFAEGGTLWVPRGIIPHPQAKSLALADLWNRPTRIARLTVHELSSIWS